MSLTDDERDKLAEAVAEKIYAREQREHPRCQCPAGNERHYQHHKLIDELVDFFTRFKSLRWGVARAVLTVMVLALVGMTSLGLVLTAWGKLKAIGGLP